MRDPTLEQKVKNSLEEGYSETEIVEALRAEDYNEGRIRAVLQDLSDEGLSKKGSKEAEVEEVSQVNQVEDGKEGSKSYVSRRGFSRKFSLMVLSPVYGILLPALLVPMISSADVSDLSGSIASNTGLALVAVVSLIVIGFGYLVDRFLYPKLVGRIQFEKQFQSSSHRVLLPAVVSLVVSTGVLFVVYPTCVFPITIFTSGCSPVTSVITNLSGQVLNNGLYLRQPHVDAFKYLGSFLGLILTLSIPLYEIILRALYRLQGS